MNQFLQLVGRLFKQVDQQIGAESDMKLDEVELSVEVRWEGHDQAEIQGSDTKP